MAHWGRPGGKTAIRRAAIPVVAAVLAASCGGFPGGTDPAAAHERAQRVLDRWAGAIAAAGAGARVVPVGELTVQVGDWEAAVGDNNKGALMAGLVAAGEGLSDARPADGTVTWSDGATTAVPVISAREALAAMTSGTAPCVDCVGLVATDARLITGPIETTRGPATAPLWQFSLQGTAVKLTRVAVANAAHVDPMFDGNPSIGLAIDSAQGSTTSTQLSVAFIGAPDPGDKACGEDYSAEAVESDLAVVVIVTRHPNFAPFGGGCSAVGARRTATATLAAALGDRVVLDLQLGTPVALDLAR